MKSAILAVALGLAATLLARSEQQAPRLVKIVDSRTAHLSLADRASDVHVGERIGPWTLMQVLPAAPPLQPLHLLVVEDFTEITGHLLVIGPRGILMDLPKTAEPTVTDSTRHLLGHSFEEVMRSPTDLLGDELLASGRDPSYEEVAAALPPIRSMPTYGFIGTPGSRDKIGFEYGGRTANFDPAPYHPSIGPIRDRGRVLDGLVGGYLPVMRFVYPESDRTWSEMIAFAPFRTTNTSASVQPVWYRIVRVEEGVLQRSTYIDSYHPFPPRMQDDPTMFWKDLLQLRAGWERQLAGSMHVDIPDERLADMARMGLVREMMTRTGVFPHYGVVDRNYAGSEHDGFPDAFTVGTEAMLAWGLIGRAGRYIDNYFAEYVRDDGSLLYRGPETGQYGRMLTLLAHYVETGGDAGLLMKHRQRIDAVTRLLFLLRAKARSLPATDPAFGMIAGWSEADAALDLDPARYMQPYFSNSTEAARGFADLGRVWVRLGTERHNAALRAWGERLRREADDLQRDIQRSLDRSLLRIDGETILPAIAGVHEPFHLAVPRDPGDPQFRSYRAYMEMLHSGNLSREQVHWVTQYRARHHDQVLGLPTAYGYATGELACFLSYGVGYGLIQHDLVRNALLLLWSDMAHGHTRGGWTAPETRSIRPGYPAAPYATPAQLVVPLMTRWMLVFEEPFDEVLWLGKALPREWLAHGQHVQVQNAPTRFGRIGFDMRSLMNEDRVEITVNVPPHFAATIKLRLRVPQERTLISATVNGRTWSRLVPDQQVILLDPPQGRNGGLLRVVAQFSRRDQ